MFPLMQLGSYVYVFSIQKFQWDMYAFIWVCFNIAEYALYPFSLEIHGLQFWVFFLNYILDFFSCVFCFFLWDAYSYVESPRL